MTNNTLSPIGQICEYLLEWTQTKFAAADGAMSPEVYDRAVSVIGIVVPVVLFCAAVAGVLIALGSFFGGWGRHK